MSTSKVLYSGPYFDGQEIEAAIACLKEGAWYPAGKEVDKFEKQFSRKFGFDSSLMVNSGSSANLVMIAALKKYFDWPDGAEIIVSVVGFPTTINPILQNNLVPKFVDVTWSDLNWNLDHVEAAITDKTVAVFSSPVLGNCYDLDRLLNICEQHKLMYIADNCDSLGSKWEGNYLTTNAVAASCSFYPAHHITTLEGGMVSSNIPEVVTLARQFAWWGRDCYCVGACNMLANGSCGKRFDTWLDEYDCVVDHKYVFSQIGYNLKPLDLQGAIGQVQLKKFDEIHNTRRDNYKKIVSFFSSYPSDVRIISEKEKAETSWFGVPIVCENPKVKHALQQHFETNGIQTRNYFAGNLLLHPAYKHLGNAKEFPVAYEVLKRVFFLGTSPSLSEDNLFYVREKALEFAFKTGIAADGYTTVFTID
jgi:CDP-6-deoxy-D-xylo-4-hexulose-3-dehydrase